MLVVFEGLDGCGKGTQIDLLKKEFPNTVVFKYPTRNTPELNDYLEKKVEIEQLELFHLFLKDITAEQEKVKEALGNGKLVVMDRYVFSTIAYEKDGITYEDGKKIVDGMNFLLPDKVILIDISADIAQARKRKQKELDRYEENKIYLEKVRSGFLKLYKEQYFCRDWRLIDGEKSIEEIHKELLEILKK